MSVTGLITRARKQELGGSLKGVERRRGGSFEFCSASQMIRLKEEVYSHYWLRLNHYVFIMLKPMSSHPRPFLPPTPSSLHSPLGLDLSLIINLRGAKKRQFVNNIILDIIPWRFEVDFFWEKIFSMYIYVGDLVHCISYIQGLINGALNGLLGWTEESFYSTHP